MNISIISNELRYKLISKDIQLLIGTIVLDLIVNKYETTTVIIPKDSSNAAWDALTTEERDDITQYINLLI